LNEAEEMDINMKNKGLTDISGILVGHASDTENHTGCTVVLCMEGAVCSASVCGGGPGSREIELLDPQRANNGIHALFLSGGSAFGLGVADGVMEYLEERDCGVDTALGKVPIVSGAVIFDFPIGNPKVRPDKVMGYEACLAASNGPIQQGNIGAGIGASVGKVLGYENMMKGGLGSASFMSKSGLIVSAMVVVNSFGDVRVPATGKILAGPIANGVRKDTISIIKDNPDSVFNYPIGNTTLAVLATNADLTKTECKILANTSSYGLARTITPFGTSMDGDIVFVLSKGDYKADMNVLGALGDMILSEATMNAVMNADAVGTVKSYKSFLRR